MHIDRGEQWLSLALSLSSGGAPFPWQLRLLRDLAAGRMPRALDLPTGLGKTSVMAIWLVALALGARLPRRLVYLVDRRAVVDQATEVAVGLRQIVERLPSLREALGLKGPLPISTLRGQHADNRDWLEDPAAPGIVIGTVDMIGSRLLFSGYGVSRKMRPYQAGLLGSDAWLVLDEAHLVPPFERLLDRIASRDDANGRTLTAAGGRGEDIVPAMQLLTLSATGRQRANDETFTLADDDLSHPVVRQRLHAHKRIRLFDAVDAKDLPDTLARHAWELCAQGRTPGRVIVFVDRREHATKLQQALDRLAGKSAPVAELFVGGRRVHEREQAARRLSTLGFLAGAAQVSDRPIFLVATSAAEVGVDLDADHAVCDLVAWERMVQRLGRVNRRGCGDASVIVVPMHSEDAAVQARNQAVLGCVNRLPLTEDGARDGSPAALSGLKADPEAAALIAMASTPALLHPPLTRALVDAWAMTSLERHSGRPEVGPWLRGWPEEIEQPQLRVLWREHLPVDDQGQVFSASAMNLFLDAAGPHLSELLEAELWQVQEWIVARVRRLPSPESHSAVESVDGPPLRLGDVAVVLVGDTDGGGRALTGDAIVAASKRDLERWLRGTTVWVDTRLGGLSADGLLDVGADAAALDVTRVDIAEQVRPVPFRIDRADSSGELEADEGWRTEVSIALNRSDDGEQAWLVVRSLLSQLAGSEEGRSGAQRAQWLSEHQDWAEAAARRLAQDLRLSEPYAEMLATAALVHDEGKQVDRWQRAFHAPAGGRPPYAKTVGRPDVALLDGYRHEFGSLPFAEAHPRVQALPVDLRELCLHLVAAHHGGARPLIRTDGAAEPPSRAVARAREVALRYAALSERWGPWGLAWWEALLRAADQQASRRNDEEGRNHG
ncbi:type I-G CRISPR-associated helicase/endonuclease Cas3g [Aquabacterium sp. OR-4]|uniref:type I-G CRISPR-associated helicase/endonuclease Cas3g n=1 Tax=Aquabacterium sp. OR-4 TaxID=2978127 RepID=UPI0028C6D6DA|nr:type I-U CRISPR-associated helicase/endonuclease Cas3 [Aquabacterium sp. OR-4]MDT7838348.1 type I-U CRISPR-associated helicase/endonuclease Cas3 [Aquabacterium sp. OR-4]